MREYWVKNGRYTGKHLIYDNPQEYLKLFPDRKLRRWSEDPITEMSIGDYIRADDDFVVQILNIYPRENLRDKTITYFVRFPMCSVYAYRRRDLTWKHQNLYAMYSYPNKNSLSNVINGLSGKSERKIKFVLLLMSGYSLIHSYRIAYNEKSAISIDKVIYRVRTLLTDKIVKDEIMKQLQELEDKLRGKITLDDFINKIKGHWDAVELGSSQELNAIKAIGQMAGFIQPKVGSVVDVPSKNIPEADEAEIVQEKPNALPAAATE